MFFCANEEGTDNRTNNTCCRDKKGNRERCKAVILKCGNAQCHSRNYRANIGFIKVGAHTCHVANVIANVICNNCRVTWVVFGNTCFNLTHKVCANVCRFCEDTAANSCKEGHRGSAHTKGEHCGGNICSLKLKYVF